MQERTRERSRAAFYNVRLTYSVLTPPTIQRLRTLINKQMIASGCMRGTFRCRQRGTIKDTPHGKYAEVRCKADYFADREAVSFNTDGFIGFAGWADEINIQPILAGFDAWVSELATRAASMKQEPAIRPPEGVPEVTGHEVTHA